MNPLSTLLLVAAPAMAATPSGVGEFSVQSQPAAMSTLTRKAVMADAFNSDGLHMNGEIASSMAEAPRCALTRETVQAIALRFAERHEFNSEISM